jgi:phospholipase C
MLPAVKSLWALPLVVLAALPALACSSSDRGSSANPPLCDPAQSQTAAADRSSCKFAAGALAEDTIGCAGRQIPIDHVVLVMQENRSFDHYFQKLPEYGQPDVDVAPAGVTNPAPDGTPIPFSHKTEYCFDDTGHSWKASHTEWDNDKNDGFAIANAKPSDPTGARAMGYYDQTDIPFYYKLASTFAISDNYHCSLLGPTWPNRMYFYAATSFGLVSNTPPPAEGNNIFKVLDAANVSWKVYRSNYPPEAMFISTFLANKDHFVAIGEFAKDAAAGTLPQVSFVDSLFDAGGAGRSSEHPPGDMQVGQKFVYDQVTTLMKSPLWKRSAMFITYDENGGLYDHVPPPKACAPDSTPPAKDANLGGFDHYGFRVPVFVISPYAKQHYVSHVLHDHTSILRFVEARFNLPALTARDANADAMMDMFDFKNPPFMTPPSFDPPPVDQKALDACVAAYPP